MKKVNKEDLFNLSIIYIIISIFLLILFLKGYIFGSNVDWISQHYSIPEYFRTLFYQDKNLLPNFALNLGLGQNIFYFSYYGLLSPLILLSYLFPFISMRIYIQIICLIMYYLSIFLLYKWLNKKYDKKVSFISTFLFAFSGPLFFHSHRHIMFVLYMPFLINSFRGIDDYFNNKKSVKLIINIFLMVMTSYLFGFSGIIAIGVYTIYKILQKDKKINFKSFIPLLKIIGYTLLAVSFAAVLLLPTFYTIISGRADSHTSLNMFNLFFTKLNFNLTFYHAYSFGLTFIYLISLISIFLKKKKEDIFLGIVLLICMLVPFASYVLNGFMYVDGKVFIPFLPLAMIVFAKFFEKLLNKDLDIKKLIIYLIPITLFIFYSAIGYSNLNLLIIDVILCMVTLLLVCKFNKKFIYLLLIIPFLSFLKLNLSDVYIKRTQIDNYYEKEIKLLLNDLNLYDYYRVSLGNNILDNVNRIYNSNQYSSSIYSSTSNSYYANFLRNIFQNEVINKDKLTLTQTSNVLFNIYSGTRYLVTTDKPLIGYAPIYKTNNVTLYENKDVLPIMYYSNKLMSIKEFESLEYPYTIDALLNYVIVDQELANVFMNKINKIDLDFMIESTEKLDYEIKDKELHINAQTNAKAKIKINQNLENQILMIKFEMNKTKNGYGCSTDISINGINNSLSCSNWKYFNDNYTFEYVLSSNEVMNYLDIKFTKGEYIISNLEFYTLDYDYVKELNQSITEVKLDKSQSNNILSGKITNLEEGYIKTSIPYEDKGFKVYVDNELVPIEMVDQAFLGFRIDSGEHIIKIVYQTPYLIEGIIISGLGLVTFIIIVFISKKQRTSKKR